MGSRLDEATEEQLREMLRLLGIGDFSPDAISYYVRWAQGTESRPLSPAAVIGHMLLFTENGLGR